MLDEISEKRVGIHWSRFKFRVELTTEKPGMIRQFYDFNQLLVRRQSSKSQPLTAENFPKLVVELITMSMALVDFTLAIGRECMRVVCQYAGILP
jgi:hypothetical protein